MKNLIIFFAMVHIVCTVKSTHVLANEICTLTVNNATYHCENKVCDMTQKILIDIMYNNNMSHIYNIQQSCSNDRKNIVEKIMFYFKIALASTTILFFVYILVKFFDAENIARIGRT